MANLEDKIVSKSLSTMCRVRLFQMEVPLVARQRQPLHTIGVGSKDDKDALSLAPPPPSMGTVLLNAATHKLRFPNYDGTEDPLP
jgi:hypothetical protein